MHLGIAQGDLQRGAARDERSERDLGVVLNGSQAGSAGPACRDSMTRARRTGAAA